MEKQREQARAKGKFKMAQGLEYEGKPTEFLGYDTLTVQACRVEAIYKDGEPVKDAEAGDEVVVVFDRTPFYAESGGQMGDKGTFKNKTTILKVDDTFKIKANVFGHMCYGRRRQKSRWATSSALRSTKKTAKQLPVTTP